MANYNGSITDFIRGDTLTVERTITLIPSGELLATAWFTIKRKYTDNDVNAVLQKVITSVDTATVGWIDDTGADGTGHILFYLTAANTALLNAFSEYKYDIQVKLSGGAIYTPESGTIVAFPQVTQNTS